MVCIVLFNITVSNKVLKEDGGTSWGVRIGLNIDTSSKMTLNGLFEVEIWNIKKITESFI